MTEKSHPPVTEGVLDWLEKQGAKKEPAQDSKPKLSIMSKSVISDDHKQNQNESK